MIEIDEHRPGTLSAILLLIGPGGAGKSSLGAALAPMLDRRLVDLDEQFRRRTGDISAFIRREGYERYKTSNSELAEKIAVQASSPTLFVTSSGFLTPDNPGPALDRNRRLLGSCYSICVLPSRDLEKAVGIIVARQLTRPFARDRAREEATIRARYPIYAGLGNLVVYADAPPDGTAQAIARYLAAKG